MMAVYDDDNDAFICSIFQKQNEPAECNTLFQDTTSGDKKEKRR